MDVAGLPFEVVASHPDVWRLGPDGAVTAVAPAHTDLYVNPAGPESDDAESLLNAPTLLGSAPPGDFRFSARLTVDFAAQYDAGVLLLWTDETHWGKFCFEFSPAAQPMVVSVITRGVSDDANAFVVPDRSVWFRVARIGEVYAYHASVDGKTWTLVRVFSLGDAVAGHRIGFEAQSPTGDGCAVRFDEIRFDRETQAELRDGS